MIKILLISPYGGTQGGISRWTEHIIDYYNNQIDKVIKLDLLPVQRSVFVNGVSFWGRLIYGFKDYAEIIRLFKDKINKQEYNLVHISTSASISLLKDLLILRIAKKYKIKSVIHFHFGRIPILQKKNNWEWKLLLMVVTKADCSIVMDQCSFEVLSQYNEHKVVFLPNPVAPRISDIVAKNFSLTQKEGNILFVGHVIKSKGIFELITAFKKINDKNLKLRIVGHIEQEMRDTIQPLINGNIEIIGEEPYDDIIKDMLYCDVFVLPSYTEGFPNVILESMACGCAIISTKVGAIPELLHEDSHGKYGILIHPQNEKELFDALRTLIYDEKLKTQCRKNSRRRVYEKYSMPTIWGQLITIWTNIATNKNKKIN